MAKVEMRLSFWAYNFTRVINILGTAGLMEAIKRVTAERRAKTSA
jgi:hypothetical protein